MTFYRNKKKHLDLNNAQSIPNTLSAIYRLSLDP